MREPCPLRSSPVKAAITPAREKAYIAVYEFESEETLQQFLTSDHLGWLREEYDAHFGSVAERPRAAYVQVWP